MSGSFHYHILMNKVSIEDELILNSGSVVQIEWESL